ncbi:MAG: heliorhodopsin HeR [Microbacteriaceae bacterium]
MVPITSLTAGLDSIDRDSVGLRRMNRAAGFLHLAQAVLVAVVVTQAARLVAPVTVDYPTAAPGVGLPQETVAVTAVDVGVGAVVVLVLAALMHLLVVSPLLEKRYRAAIDLRRNPIRWVELSTTSAIMVFLLAQLNGVTNLSTLVLVYVVQSALVILLWLQEKLGTPARTLQPFIYATMVGIVPWGIMALTVLAPGASSGFDQPVWIRALTVVMLVLFFGFGIIQWLGYTGVFARFTYLNEERAYIALSLVTKAAFAWQVTAGILSTGPIPAAT